MLFAGRIPSDRAVIQRVLRGRREDFGILVERHLGAVQAVAYAHVGNYADAEDVAQETFVRAFRTLDSLRDWTKLRSWLTTIARNQSHRLGAKRGREQEVREQFKQETVREQAAGPERRELHAMLHRTLEELDEDHREVLMLHYFAQNDTAEIAYTLDISKEAAKKRLQRARKALGERLMAELDDVMAPRRPTGERVAKVMAAVAQVSPAWLGSLGAGPALSGLLGRALGGSTLVKAGAGLASVVLAVLLGAQLFGREATEAPKVETAALASDQHEAGDAPSVTPAAEAESALAPGGTTPGASEDTGEGTDGADSSPAGASASRPKGPRPTPRPMVGGNAQHTGFFELSGPLEEPAILWAASLGEPGNRPCAQVIQGPGGNLYLNYGTDAQEYFACYSADGQLLWERGPFEMKRSFGTPVITPAGAIVATFRDQFLRAYDWATGDTLWTADVSMGETRGFPATSPVVDRLGNVYLSGSVKAGLFKLDGLTGRVVWSNATPAEAEWRIGASPALSPDERTVYVSRGNVAPCDEYDGIYAVDTDTGQTRWHFHPEGEEVFNGSWPSPMVGPDGTIYQQNEHNGRLFAVADQGDRAEIQWIFDTNSHRNAPRLPAMDDDTIYVGSVQAAARLYALDLDGALRWEQMFPGLALGSPVVTPDAVYITEEIEGAVYALDRSDGAILWRLQLARPLTGSVSEAVTIGPDGTLYLATSGVPEDGNQCALLALR